jgi:hypothetical protein
MTTPLQYPLVNGVRHSWASIEAKVAGQTFYITSVNYARKRNRTMVRVNHPDPIAKTRGSNDYTADIEMLLAEFNAFQTILIAQANAAGLNGGYGDVAFQVVVSYTENGLDTVTDTIIGCTMDSTDASNAEGTDASKRKMDLAPLKILYGGSQDDLAAPLQAPPGG